jgi:hypothetical protein
MHPAILQPVRGATVALRGVRKVYGRGDRAVCALDGVDVDFYGGTFTAVMVRQGRARAHCCIARRAWNGRPLARHGWPELT